MRLTIQCAGLTDPGRVREKNEDNWGADAELGLFMVADGMGGQFAGELASKVVVQMLPALIRQRLTGSQGWSMQRIKRQLLNAIAKLSSNLNEQTRNEPGLAGMGSTVVCALIRGRGAIIGYMGDSRAYCFRQGKLKCLTKDHTIAQLLLSSGEISVEEASDHPGRTRLTRSVGMDGLPLPQARNLTLKPGDLLLLCSDGLTAMISDPTIQSILLDGHSLEEKCSRLIAGANEAGGKDNITVVLLSVSEALNSNDGTARQTREST